MQTLRTILFYIFLCLWTPIIFLVLSPLLLTFNHRIVNIIGCLWAHVILRALGAICNLTFHISGVENIPKAPFIVASKHQSTWETVFFTAYFKNGKYILKKELTRIPIYGWYLLLSGMIYIDRKLGVRSMKKVISDTTRSLNQGNIIIIFPEGTRVKPGEDSKIQSGIAAIHKHNEHIPIVPVSLNSGYYWPKGLSVIKPGIITIKFHKAIDSKLGKEELLRKIKEKLD